MQETRAFTFQLPTELNAVAPPERRGIRRDHVRLLVLDRRTGNTADTRFDRVGDYLRPGDLLVLNNSRTLPAVLPALNSNGSPVEIRLARRVDGPVWLALLSGPGSICPGMQLSLPEGLNAAAVEEVGPFWSVRFNRQGSDLYDTFYRIGQPVRYEYIRHPWELDYYQTVFASTPGSVEMPSAGRAFSWELMLSLRRRSIRFAFLSLHTTLSYGEGVGAFHPREQPEEYFIPPETAAAIAEVRRTGGRVIAVGTTVVRALESATPLGGGERRGWAQLYIDGGYRLQVADGILTGLHEPEASHLDMLSAFISADALRDAYEGAVTKGYLWHEFGDLNLII